MEGRGVGGGRGVNKRGRVRGKGVEREERVWSQR